ncbi:streptomycin 3-kinase [Dyadobacter sp. SG02]|uniref:APH(3'') family aminoglycoside O-phosphotransferase n=1 Tax=Dyadobacter sp. SG02 TaxID=1855291 RepID=UPI0008CED968|nr:APH(3'') family aminoglycoside O-phosphotransferase [Dyadobacter sp. SG02]SEJ37496.1 streptomycin 3-kinase [Dyadobacter sp. SG02]
MAFQVQARQLLPKLPGKLEWQVVGDGESGDMVFRRSDGAAFAKVANESRIHTLEAEYLRTNWLSGQQIGSAQVLDWSKSDQYACLITSCVPGVSASALPPADLLKAWPSIAEKFRHLHQLPSDNCPFERRVSQTVQIADDVVKRNAVNKDFLDDADKNTPFEQLLDPIRPQVPLRIMQETTDLAVCHGDACMPNIMVDPKTLICTGIIDLGRLGLSDRYQDLALMIGNTRETWEDQRQAEKALQILFDIHNIPIPDLERLAFYLKLDPLTWG